MGRKVKKAAQKIPDEEDNNEEVPEEKPKKKQTKSSFDLKDVFSESIRGRLTQYIQLNQEVLSLKGEVEGSDVSEEISERKNKMAERVESAATEILKNELGALEEWMGDQQVKLSDQIVHLGKVYEENKSNLASTNCFKESEILSMINPIQARSNERQKGYDEYASLIAKSKSIYN